MINSISSRELRSLRPPKASLDPMQAYGFQIELEPGDDGPIRSLVVFLVGAECRWTCSMCDLWKATLSRPTERGSLPIQLRKVLDQVSSELGNIHTIKLYNASNFFDSVAVPKVDLNGLAELCDSFQRVVVENHASMIRTKRCQESIIRFADRLTGKLEVAMGLETTHYDAMQLLNKNMTLEDFEFACEWLKLNDVDSRSFVLLQPPGICAEESVKSSLIDVRYAIECGVRLCALIPTRAGNGWLEKLISTGQWSPPTSVQFELALDLLHRDGLPFCKDLVHGESKDWGNPSLKASNTGYHGKRFVVGDLWDWDQLDGTCSDCCAMRKERLHQMNLQQRWQSLSKLECDCSVEHIEATRD